MYLQREVKIIARANLIILASHECVGFVKSKRHVSARRCLHRARLEFAKEFAIPTQAGPVAAV
jgi:hypothetical protein